MSGKGPCSFSGCKNTVSAKGLCGTHYWQRSVGRELTPIRYRGAGKRDRFWEKVDKNGPTVLPSLGPCWLWKGAIQQGTEKHGVDDGGYGLFWLPPDNMIRAHKYSYQLAKGPVPPGLELDHLCRTRLCVNPDHLEAVTHAVNVQRAFDAARKVPASESPTACAGCAKVARKNPDEGYVCALHPAAPEGPRMEPGPCANWCGRHRDYGVYPQTDAAHKYYYSGGGGRRWNMYCTEACRDAGKSINPVEPSPSRGAAK